MPMEEKTRETTEKCNQKTIRETIETIMNNIRSLESKEEVDLIIKEVVAEATTTKRTPIKHTIESQS